MADVITGTDKGEVTLALTSETKSAVSEKLTGTLARVTAISRSVSEATEAEDGSTKLPAELVDHLKAISHEVSGLLVEHALEKGANEAAESLVQISEMSMSLAEEVATSGEIDPEAKARMGQMAKLLSAVAGDG